MSEIDDFVALRHRLPAADPALESQVVDAVATLAPARDARGRSAVGFVLAAAVLIAAVVVVVARHPTSTVPPPAMPATRPTTTWPTAPPVKKPVLPPHNEAATAARHVLLPPGRWFDNELAASGYNVAFTVPAGWRWDGRYLTKGGDRGATISFYAGPIQVYTDPCHWSRALPNPPTGATVNDLIAALAVQRYRAAAAPIYHPMTFYSPTPPYTLLSLPGKAIALTVPADMNVGACDRGEFRTWGPTPYVRANQGPGQRDLIWAVPRYAFDAGPIALGDTSSGPDDRVIVDVSTFPDTPTAVTAEIGAILNSLYFGHWG